MMSWPEDVFVLIPAYKAAESLRAMLPGLLAVVPPRFICVSDDGSMDDTVTVCGERGVLYVSSKVNEGKGAALSRGFRFLLDNNKPSWIITMDADGQHAVSDIPEFLHGIRNNPCAGIIIGRRSKTPGTMPLARIFSNTVTSLLLSILAGTRISDSQSGFRAYSARLLAAVECRYNRFEFESEMILRACAGHFSVSFIPVQTLYFSSQSHIAVVPDTLRWLRAVVSLWIELKKKDHYDVHTET
jgi:glycosyltransferase involved in cell wall biosynthesis